MNEKFEKIITFAETQDLNFELCRIQLRCLWTSHCMFEDTPFEPSDYEQQLKEIWNHVEMNPTNYWSNRISAGWDDFKSYMNKHIERMS